MERETAESLVAHPSVEALLAQRTLSFHFGDESFVEVAKAGHSTAFAALSEQYRERLFRAAHRITRNREDAEDAVQDTLLRAFVHMRDFEGRSNFGTWLTRITINSALMILRKKRATSEIAIGGSNDFGLDSLRYEIADHAPNPEMWCVQSEKQRILRTAVRSLRPRLQAVVQIQLQGRSAREAAEAIGVSLTAAKARLFHAKKALRRAVIRKLVYQTRFAPEMHVLTPRALLREKFSGVE